MSAGLGLENLEPRRLLSTAGSDPVVVLTEWFRGNDVYGQALINNLPAHLWVNPAEYPWPIAQYDADPPPWHAGEDGDGNGYADDAYGWNFNADSPQIAVTEKPGEEGAGTHGQGVAAYAVQALQNAGDAAARVKIMFVISSEINGGSDALQYILDRKAAGVNIVALGGSRIGIDRAGAEALREAGILIFRSLSNANIDRDPFPGRPGDDSIMHATPRSGIQLPSLGNVLPITTVFSQTDYGINSFYFSPPGTIGEQSFASPAASMFAGIAVQAYQDAHAGATPTWPQIKRALMSGVDYDARLEQRTITHDYVAGERSLGGVLNPAKIIAAINTDTPALTNVRIGSTGHGQSFGTLTALSLHADGAVSNWTINWGDNTPSQIVAGSQTSVTHEYPALPGRHLFYPTAFAVSAADGQVYLAGDTRIVTFNLAAPIKLNSIPFGRGSPQASPSVTDVIDRLDTSDTAFDALI